MDIGLWYLKSDNFEFIGFSDADFAGYRVERKNTSDTCHFLGHSLVSWHNILYAPSHYMLLKSPQKGLYHL